MYRINRIGRPVLITVDEVIAKAAVDENADIRFLLSSIEVAEERFISGALGSAFYEDFISKKNVEVTGGNHDALVASINTSLVAAGKNQITGADLVEGMIVNAIELCPDNYKALWNRFLWKITAEAVDIVAITPSWLRTTAKGQTYNNPKVLTSEQLGSASGDRKDVEFKIQTMCTERLYPIIESMKKWICVQGGYPLFDCGDDKGGCKGKGSVIKAGIITGIYNDHDRLGHNNRWGRDEEW